MTKKETIDLLQKALDNQLRIANGLAGSADKQVQDCLLATCARCETLRAAIELLRGNRAEILVYCE